MTTSDNVSQAMPLPLLLIWKPGYDHCGEKKTQTAISEGEYREQTGKAGAGILLSQ